MAKPTVTSKGVPLQLGRELGVGGEGSVFDVPALPAQVAKLYHHAIDAKKQEKLAFMAAHSDEQLLKYVAWPLETLHSTRSNSVVGFLMSKVAARSPIHMVYSPAYRRQEKPRAAWDFLLYVARNTAAAFEVLHARGHVLGDVNQGNILVGGDSKVILIDSDSFQIRGNRALYLCEVGVSHFTPPELQGISSFDKVPRTPNHDNFGLALIIFHLLFGGRHPYSGVPLRKGVGEALESDIKGYRYAYARDAQSRGTTVPPRSIPITVVPEQMEAMFHLAFTEKGPAGGRPGALQWVTELDALRKSVRSCSASPMHRYPSHLLKCPWCALDQQGVVYFIDLGTIYTGAITGFVLTKAWALIESVSPPPTVQLPHLGNISVVPRPLPSGIPGKGSIIFFRAAVLFASFTIMYVAPQFWFVGALVGFVGWTVAGSFGSKERKAERQRRTTERDNAKRTYEHLVQQASSAPAIGMFQSKRAELVKLRDEYQANPAAEQRALADLHTTAEQRQRHKFLDGFFIDGASISGIGPGRKATLGSFGIETAADIDRQRIGQLKGFGDTLTQALMDWRAVCERKFTFNPKTAVSEADRNAVRAKFGARRFSIEGLLRNGPIELRRFRQAAVTVVSALQPQLDAAGQQLVQAQKDLSLI